MPVHTSHNTASVTAKIDLLGDYALVDAIEAIVEAADIEDVWANLTRFCGSLGFDRLFYGLTHHRTEQSFGDLDDLVVLSNACGAYVNQFIGREMFRKAPMVHWANRNVGAQSWRVIAERAAAGQLSDEELEAVAFNQEFGVTAGFTISFPETHTRNRGALALMAPKGASQDEADAIWDRHGRVLSAVANVAHLKITRLPHYGARRQLTQRQREVLSWVGDGKTNQDIATILGLTSATVEKHLRLAREVLDVDTTAQAVLKASIQNQIYPVTT